VARLSHAAQPAPARNQRHQPLFAVCAAGLSLPFF
jgi:hypothetical protein